MKYLVNNTAMSYKFITGLVLKKQSAMAIEEDKLEDLKKDFQFNSLTEHKLVLVTENKPKSLISAAEEIAEKEILEWVYCIVIALILAMLFRYFIGTPTIVKQKSMYPTLKPDQRLILNKKKE